MNQQEKIKKINDLNKLIIDRKKLITALTKEDNSNFITIHYQESKYRRLSLYVAQSVIHKEGSFQKEKINFLNKIYFENILECLKIDLQELQAELDSIIPNKEEK
jgi:hypothetical protein